MQQYKTTIALTGVTGQIGYHVTKQLLKDGYQVKALVRQVPDYIRDMPLHLINGDVTDSKAVHQLMQGADYCIHLAAKIVLRKDRSGETEKINVDGVNNILNAASETGIRRLIHFSSIHAYDPQPEKPVMDETNRLNIHSSILYESTKSKAQQNVTDFSRRHGLDVIILNPTAVICPEDYKPSNTAKALKDMYLGRLPLLPDGGFNWVDARDIAAVTLKAMYQGKPGEAYILGGNYHTWKEIAIMIRQITGKKIAARTIPLRFLKPVGRLMETLADLTGLSPLFTEEAIHHLEQAHQNISSDKAIHELGYTFRPLYSTVEDTMNWLLKSANSKGYY